MRKLVGRGLIAAGVLCGTAWVYLFFHYLDIEPRRPSPETGETIQLNSHGTIAYITTGQDTVLNVLSDAAIISWFVGGLLLYAELPKRK